MPSLYSRRLLPWLIDRQMKGRHFQRLRRDALSDARGKILEIGFGSGLNLTEYPSLVSAVTALDPSAELYGLSKKNIRPPGIAVDFVPGSAEQMPFREDAFDTVVSTWTLCSVPDVHRALDEVFRVLKPGGSLLFIEHGLSRHPALRRLQHLLTPAWKKVAGGCHLDRDVCSLVRQHGFTCTCADLPAKGIARPLMRMYQGKAVKPMKK